MGQSVAAIMYGVREESGWHLRRGDDENDADGMLDLYGRGEPDEDEGCVLLGYVVAVSHGWKRGAVPIEKCVALDDVPVTAPYAEAYRKAVERWEKFASWAKTQGVPLPAARLWLTTVEVA